MTIASKLRNAALAAVLSLSVATLAHAAGTDVPASGASPKIDAIKARSSLKAAAIGEFPWLPENTSGSGDQFSGPAWMLANEYAKRLGVKLEIVPVSHETKVPILATGEADISIAPLAVTPKRQEVVDFIVYSQSSLCMFGLADNPKLKDVKTVDDLNNADLSMAYFTGTPPETWAPTRFPKVTMHGVAGSGANAPVEEIMAKRADFATIDNVAWPQLQKQVPGLTAWPAGDDCLKSSEMSTPVGLAVDKKDPVFRDWLQAVYDSMKDQVTNEEIKMLKGE